MAERKRSYPVFQMMLVPPDPRRKSNNLVILLQPARWAPLEMFCASSCAERGKTRPTDNGCRHTDIVKSSLKPYWQRRARPVLGTEGRSAHAS